MICPNCHAKMEHDFCIRCGYMTNGNQVNLENPYPKESYLEIYIGEDFFKVLHGENNLTILLLGPLYFCYRTHFLLGMILGIIDISLAFYIGSIYSNLLMSLLTIFLCRFVYMVFANALFLKLSERNINKILKKDQTNSLKIISDRKSKRFSYLLISILIIILYIMLIIALYTK